ncbi:22309_t:CDS:2, partial [Gigaspora rosea]
MRKVAIIFKNETPLIFERPEIYYRFGTSSYSPISITPVKNGEGMVFGALNTPYTFRGTEGFIKVYDGFINPSIDLFHEMRDESHIGGDGKIYEGTLGGGLCYSGSMGGTAEPHVEIKLEYCSSNNETR